MTIEDNIDKEEAIAPWFFAIYVIETTHNHYLQRVWAIKPEQTTLRDQFASSLLFYERIRRRLDFSVTFFKGSETMCNAFMY